MPHYSATIDWQRGDAAFSDNAYSRAHTWRFDGGLEVPASASPHHVRSPWSVAENIDPEEAFIAAASSCHMLWFLYFAALDNYCVDSYTDSAEGASAKNAAGFDWLPRITLKPHIVFSGAKHPTAHDVETLHHKAHQACHIANSVKAEIITAGSFSIA